MLAFTPDNIVLHTIQTMPDLVDVGNINMLSADGAWGTRLILIQTISRAVLYKRHRVLKA